MHLVRAHLSAKMGYLEVSCRTKIILYAITTYHLLPQSTQESMSRRQNESVTTSLKSEISLLTQLLRAVVTKYLDKLEDPILGFGLVSAKEILAFLFKTYGKIGPADLDTNIKVMESDWDANESIAEIWTRVKNCRNFATAGNRPIGDSELMHKLLAVFDKTGLFGPMCTKYGEMDPDQWEWATFKSDFDGADKHRCKKLTAKAAGFNTANMATAEVNVATKEKMPATTKTLLKFDPKEHHLCLPERAEVIFYCWTHEECYFKKKNVWKYSSWWRFS